MLPSLDFHTILVLIVLAALSAAITYLNHLRIMTMYVYDSIGFWPPRELHSAVFAATFLIQLVGYATLTMF